MHVNLFTRVWIMSFGWIIIETKMASYWSLLSVSAPTSPSLKPETDLRSVLDALLITEHATFTMPNEKCEKMSLQKSKTKYKELTGLFLYFSQ